MNLYQSTILGALELPVAPAPREAWTTFGDVDPGPETVRDAAQLLRGCELERMEPIHAADDRDDAVMTDLQTAVAQCYADAFSLTPSEEAAMKEELTPAVAAVQAPPSTERKAQDRLAALQPSSNKRRRSRAKTEELPAPVSTEQVEAAMKAVICDAGGLANGEIEEADGHLSDDGAGQGGLQARRIQLLGSEVQRCQASFAQLPQELLASCLAALHGHVRSSEDINIQGWEEEDSEDVSAVLESLDASVTMLHIMLARGVPQQLMREDLIVSLLMTAKQQLLLNVLAKKQDADGVAPPNDTGARAKKGAGGRSYRASAVFLQLADRVRKVLVLLADLLEAVRIEETFVMPLIRIAAETFTAADLEALQGAASDFIVAVFKQYGQQRDLIFDDVLNTVLPSIPVAKAKKAAGGKNKPATQRLTSLVLRMVQDSAAVPPAGSEPAHWEQSLFPASRWIDYFWVFCISRCTSSKAAKSDMQSDMKTVVERVVADLLACYSKPDSPAAALMLNRLCSILGSGHGIASSESNARQLAIELLSTIGAQLFGDAKKAEGEVASEAVPASMSSDAAARREQLLQHLSRCSQGEKDGFASALRFRLYQTFLDDVYSPAAVDSNFDGAAALEDIWRLKAQAAADTSPELPAGQAELLARLEALHQLGRLRTQLLKWLHACIEAKDSGPAVRARIVRAVGAFVQADARLLSNDHVASCFKIALEDESPSVRLESLNLLGLHISSSAEPDVADTCYGIVASSVGDASVGVRKAAMKMIWESCVLRPSFSRRAEACYLIAQRAAEDEESVQELVSKCFHAMLFSYAKDGPEEVKQRAAQLARIAGHISSSAERGQQRQMLFPLEAAHPLVWVLSKAAGAAKADRSNDAGRDLAAALLGGIISGQEDAADAAEASQQRFSYLLALHALSLSDVQLCIPPENPARFVACLAPYLKADGGGKAGQERAAQTDAEQLVCVLAIVGSVLPELKAVSGSLAKDLEADMVALVRSHAYQSVVAAACQAIGSLHRIAPGTGGQLTWLASRYLELITQCCEQGYQANSSRFSKRYLCVLGQILRHGAAIVEEKSQAEDFKGQPLSAALCYDTAAAICQEPAASVPLREQALRTMGMIAVARPDLLLSERSRSILAAALQPGADFMLMRAALSLVLDLLKHEEGDLRGRSQAAAQRRGKKAAAARVNTQNGERDALSAGNSILQENVDHVLRLTTCTQISCSAQMPGPERLPGMVRHGAVQVVEVVERNGVLPPWTFVPHLIAVITDASRESATAELALRILKQVAAKHQEIVLRALGTGLEVAANFQQQLSAAAAVPGAVEWTAAPQSAMLGLQTLYADVLQPSKQGRAAMVSALLKRLEAACAAGSTAGTPTELAVVCAHLAVELPWKRGDEVLPLVAGLSQIAAHAGDSTLRSLKQLASQPAAAGPAARAAQQTARAGFALAAVLRAVELLMAAHSLSAERVAASQQNPEKRKAEERAQFQPLREVFALPVSLAAFQSQPASQQYAGLKALLSKFHLEHNHLLVGRGEGQPEVGSPQGAATPAWAQTVAAAKKGGQSTGPRSLGSGRPGKRPGSRKRAPRAKAKKARREWSGSESDEPDAESE